MSNARRAIVALLGGVLLGGTVCAADLLPSQQYDAKTKTATASGNVTDSVIWTPASGARIILQGAIFCADRAADTVELETSTTDVISPFAIESYGCHSFGAGNGALWMGTVDATLNYTVRTSGTVSVTLWGYEALP